MIFFIHQHQAEQPSTLLWFITRASIIFTNLNIWPYHKWGSSRCNVFHQMFHISGLSPLLEIQYLNIVHVYIFWFPLYDTEFFHDRILSSCLIILAWLPLMYMKSLSECASTLCFHQTITFQLKAVMKNRTGPIGFQNVDIIIFPAFPRKYIGTLQILLSQGSGENKLWFDTELGQLEEHTHTR